MVDQTRAASNASLREWLRGFHVAKAAMIAKAQGAMKPCRIDRRAIALAELPNGEAERTISDMERVYLDICATAAPLEA